MAAGVPLEKVAAKSAAEVCKKFPLSDEGQGLLADGLAPGDFLGRLLEKALYSDAIRLLAHALPKREAVWWACLCARAAHGATPPDKIAQALAAAERWVTDPSEDNRRAAMPAAEAAEFETPAGCAAVAAFWSGGSLAPPDAPVVPPPDHLTGHGASCAVILAGVIQEPQKAPEKYRTFLAQGQDVANAKNRWKEAAPAAPAAPPAAPKPAPAATEPPSSQQTTRRRW